MADLHILREHTLGFVAARKIAFQWAEQAEGEFGMACTYEEGEALDEVHFTRSGVQGSLKVSQDLFELQAKLGFLLGAFKGAIEAEIVKNLDTLLAPPASPEPAPATPVKKKRAAAKKVTPGLTREP
jgi:putative polyhydroxyalkanoate system protein